MDPSNLIHNWFCLWWTGHSPPGYLSAVKITQMVASDSLLADSFPGGKHGSSGHWVPPLSFSQELCLQGLAGPSKVPGGFAAQQQPTLQAPSHPISPGCCNSSSSRTRSRGLPVLCADTLQLLLLNFPWTCFPLACLYTEKMIVAKPGSEPRSTQSHMQRQKRSTPLKTCFVLMPKGRNCVVLATVQM